MDAVQAWWAEEYFDCRIACECFAGDDVRLAVVVYVNAL